MLSTRAAGLGINLTSADVCIFHDIDWNPEIDRQAEARCHRIGQYKPVTVFKLLMKYTIDEYIFKLAEYKKERNNLIIEKDKTGSSVKRDDLINIGDILASLFAQNTHPSPRTTATSVYQKQGYPPPGAYPSQHSLQSAQLPPNFSNVQYAQYQRPPTNSNPKPGANLPTNMQPKVAPIPSGLSTTQLQPKSFPPNYRPSQQQQRVPPIPTLNPMLPSSAISAISSLPSIPSKSVSPSNQPQPIVSSFLILMRLMHFFFKRSH